MAGVISYNSNKPNPLYIYRATSGGTVFSANLTANTAFDIFTDTAVVNDAIYFSGQASLQAFSNLYMTIGTAMAGTYTLIWEYWYRPTSGSATWRTMHNLTDGSNNFTTTGDVVITFPFQVNAFYGVVNGVTCSWVRCRIVSATSITEGGATITNRVRHAQGIISIDGYTDDSPCTWEILYQWILANAPEIGAYKWGTSFYKFDNCSIYINTTLRSRNEVVFMGNGCYYQGYSMNGLWSGDKSGTNGWLNSSSYYVSTMGPSSILSTNVNSRVYGGLWSTSSFANIVDGVTCFAGGYTGLYGGDVIGVYAPQGGYFSTGNIDRCTVEGGIITASKPTTYPTNLQISNPKTGIWSLYGNELDCADLTYVMPSSTMMGIGTNYQVGYNYNINIKNPNPALPSQTGTPKIITRSIGALTAFDKVFYYDESLSSFTDYTTQASSATADDVPLSGDVNDCFYFKTITYANTSASNLNIHFTITNQANDYEYVWEYLKGTTWTTVPTPLFFDTTDNLTKNGNVYICTGGNNYPISATTINGVNASWYRLRIITKGTGSPVASVIKYKQETGAGTYSINEIYTTQFTVVDGDKNPIQDVDVSITNVNGTVINLTTDVNGQTTATDITTTKTVFDPLAPIADYNYVKTSLSPFTIVFSKAGYETYTTKTDITEKLNSITTLKPIVIIRQSLEGKLLLANQAELGSSSKLLEV